MKVQRHRSPKDFPRRCNANGQPLCRFCGQIVTPPRQTFCSNACVNAYLAATSASHLRAQVSRRDKGVCALCRCDTAKVKRVLDYLAHGFRLGFNGPVLTPPDTEAHAFVRSHLDIPESRIGRELWDADHIVPVCEGGESRLSNMRTLCLSCHRQVTYQLTLRRVQRRNEDASGRNLQHQIG